MAKNDFDVLMSVGVDISKDVFHLIGFDKEGQLTLSRGRHGRTDIAKASTGECEMNCSTARYSTHYAKLK